MTSRIHARVTFWHERKHIQIVPLLRFIVTSGLSYWSSTYPSTNGCSTNSMLNPHHLNWLVCTRIKKMWFPNGWLCKLFQGVFDMAYCNLVPNLWTFTVMEVKLNGQNVESSTIFLGWMAHVRVNKLSYSSVQTKFNLILGKLDQLFFDSTCWWWPKVTPFLAYSTKLDRKWITT